MPRFIDVRLAIQDGNMLAAATGARVATVRRNDLEVPGQP
jgi:1,6-anhydro-N-acetylmuramate kinase